MSRVNQNISQQKFEQIDLHSFDFGYTHDLDTHDSDRRECVQMLEFKVAQIFLNLPKK